MAQAVTSHRGPVTGTAARARRRRPFLIDLYSTAVGKKYVMGATGIGRVVREALRDFQRQFAAREPGAVIDGRDIGTVIAPEATAKLFVTATPEVRAARRWKQLTARGFDIAFDDMLADIRRRDERDAGRGAAPMVQADDAVLLDTTDMDIEAAFDAARRIVEAARAKHGL